MAKRGRTNSFTKKRFMEMVTTLMGSHLGITPNETLTNIQVLNNTVVITMKPKPPKYGNRRGQNR